MSGLAGILRFDGASPDEADLRAMADALAHRGPDGARIVRDGPLGLVHVLLKIDDEAPQPLHEGSLLLALDGRVDNPGLLSKLEHRNASKNGPESVLAAWRKRGARALPLILGDWALALWDGKTLTLARDPIGLKPLFYFQDESKLVFASEIKAILPVAGVPCEPDELTLSELPTFRFRSMERTFFNRIKRLMPGAALRVERERVSSSIFWQPNPYKKVRLPSREAYRAKFRELFVEAVRRRLPKGRAAAIRLSGGLDSSAIAGAAALARAERPGLSLTSVSIASDAFPATDERKHSNAVCAEFRIGNRVVLAENVDLAGGLETALYYQECPVLEPIDVWVLEQFRVAAEDGAKVVLGGDWGDQVMGCGAGYLADLLRAGRLISFARETSLYRGRNGASWREVLKPVFWYLVLPARVKDRYDGLRHLARKIFRPFKPTAPGGPAFPLAAQRERYDAAFGVHNVVTLETLDKQGAQYGVEARLPFLDRKLVSFMLAIPSEELSRDGVTRRLEREALDGILPAAIAARLDKGDCTDLEIHCLARAGFTGDTTLAWRERTAAVWRSVWTRKRSTTRRLASSSTATCAS